MDFPNKAARLDYLLKEEIEGGGEITVSWTAVTDKPTTFPSTWATVSGKPTTFPSTWATVSGKPAVIGAGADAAAARTAIGAGTSNLEIGTAATQAKAGNYQPAWAQVTGKPTTFAPVPATTTVVGGVNQAAAVPDAAAAPTMEEFNALLAALRAAGVIAP